MFKFFPGIYSGWSLGANNTANVSGPQVNSGIIKYRSAIILTAIFVIIGALLEGKKCLPTIGGITHLVVGTAILSCLVAGLSVHIMSYLKLPVSTSQTIIGALIGIGLVEGSGINYQKLSEIFISWILTPVGAGIIAYVLYRILSFIWQRRVKNLMVFNRTVGIFSVIIGCYAAYSLGANNLANTTGPYAAAKMLTPFWACLIGGVSIALGVLTYSKNVMETIGKKITTLDPFSAMISVLATASTLHIYAQIGIPVSSSQAIVGAVVGVGLTKGTRMVNKKTLITIFSGWIFSVVGAGILAYGLGWIVRLFMK